MLNIIKARIRDLILRHLEPQLNLRGLKTVSINFEKEIAQKLEAETAQRVFDQRNQWLRETPFRTVLDIGASTGISAKTFRRFWPSAKIFAFEPLESCFQELSKSFLGDTSFIAFHTALGAREGVSDINKNEYSYSSSLLQMDDLHVKSFPFTSNSSLEQVTVRRLDDILGPTDLVRPVLMKLDVQGFEGQVIQGGLETIKCVDTIITEMSVAPLYKGQIEFDELYRLLVSLGFQYRGNYDQLHDPLDGRILQVDGIFVRAMDSNQ